MDEIRDKYTQSVIFDDGLEDAIRLAQRVINFNSDASTYETDPDKKEKYTKEYVVWAEAFSATSIGNWEKLIRIIRKTAEDCRQLQKEGVAGFEDFAPALTNLAESI
jgi:hypothetical protein